MKDGFVISTVRVGANLGARRAHLITASTAAAILDIDQEEIERRRESEASPWGLSIVHCAPDGAEYVAEEVLELAELWDRVEQQP